MSDYVAPKVCYENEARLLERRRLRNRVARVLAKLEKQAKKEDRLFEPAFIKRRVMGVFKT